MQTKFVGVKSYSQMLSFLESIICSPIPPNGPGKQCMASWALRTASEHVRRSRMPGPMDFISCRSWHLRGFHCQNPTDAEA